jgi:hypothetical protein
MPKMASAIMSESNFYHIMVGALLLPREEKDRPAHGEMGEEGIKITRSKYTGYMGRKKDALRLDSDKRQVVSYTKPMKYKVTNLRLTSP